MHEAALAVFIILSSAAFFIRKPFYAVFYIYLVDLLAAAGLYLSGVEVEVLLVFIAAAVFMNAGIYFAAGGKKEAFTKKDGFFAAINLLLAVFIVRFIASGNLQPFPPAGMNAVETAGAVTALFLIFFSGYLFIVKNMKETGDE